MSHKIDKEGEAFIQELKDRELVRYKNLEELRKDYASFPETEKKIKSIVEGGVYTEEEGKEFIEEEKNRLKNPETLSYGELEKLSGEEFELYVKRQQFAREFRDKEAAEAFRVKTEKAINKILEDKDKREKLESVFSDTELMSEYEKIMSKN